MEAVTKIKRAVRRLRDKVVVNVRPLFMSKEERDWLNGAVKFFLDNMKVEVECGGLDEWHCYNRAREYLYVPWVEAERLTGLVFDPLDDHCGGLYDDVYGLFWSPGDGCTPLAEFKEHVEYIRDASGKLIGARLWFELIKKNF